MIKTLTNILRRRFVTVDYDGSKFVATINWERGGAMLYEAGFTLDTETWNYSTYDPSAAKNLYQYATEKARLAIDSYLISIEQSSSVIADVQTPAPTGLFYADYQKAVIKFARLHDNCLVADDMGLGKTIESIGILNDCDDVKSVLVVCPPHLRINWKRELEKWMCVPRSIEITDSRNFPSTDVVIISYNLLDQYKEQVQGKTWDMLISDEVQYAKNNKTAARSQALIGPWDDPSRSVQASKKIFLTGTPIVKSPSDMWSILNYLKPGAWGSFKEFDARYNKGEGYFINSNSNDMLAELYARLRSTVMIRRRKSEVLKELPPKTREVIEFPPDALTSLAKKNIETTEALETSINCLVTEVESLQPTDDIYVSKVSELRKKVSEYYDYAASFSKELSTEKLPLIKDHIRYCLANGSDKIVIFTYHVNVADSLYEEFKDISVRYVGDVEAKQGCVDAFQEDAAVKLFITTIGAGCTGITLTAASHEIFTEMYWVPHEIMQAEDRCHRRGQLNNVLIQYLAVHGTTDCDMAVALVERHKIIEKVLDNIDVGEEERLIPFSPRIKALAGFRLAA